MHKEEDGMHQSWFHKFCDWHHGNESEAVVDWVDLVVTVHANAKKLEMIELTRIVLMHTYKFIVTSPQEAKLVVPEMHKRSLHNSSAKELQLLAQCCHEVGCNSKHRNTIALLSHGKNGIINLPGFDKESTFDETCHLVNLGENNIVAVTCSPHELMNGFHSQIDKQSLNQRIVITYRHEDESFFLEEEWETNPNDGVAGTGTLYTTQTQKMEHNKCRRHPLHQCHWNEDTEHPVWVSQTNSHANQHPVLFRFCFI